MGILADEEEEEEEGGKEEEIPDWFLCCSISLRLYIITSISVQLYTTHKCIQSQYIKILPLYMWIKRLVIDFNLSSMLNSVPLLL